MHGLDELEIGEMCSWTWMDTHAVETKEFRKWASMLKEQQAAGMIATANDDLDGSSSYCPNNSKKVG